MTLEEVFAQAAKEMREARGTDRPIPDPPDWMEKKIAEMNVSEELILENFDQGFLDRVKSIREKQ